MWRSRGWGEAVQAPRSNPWAGNRDCGAPRAAQWEAPLHPWMASEIFGTAALFWVLIPVGMVGGALLLKLLDE